MNEMNEINITKNVSPLRYPGGKTRACKILEKTILKYFNTKTYDTILSPFFGGGSFEFHWQNNHKHKLIVNDKFIPLFNFWSQVKTNKIELCDELSNIVTVSKNDFLKFRNSILNLNDDMVEQAKQYFIINRCSFSGATLSGGFSDEASKKRYTKSSIDRIRKLNLDHLEIFNLDFSDFINNHWQNNTLMFLDPPYYLNEKSKLYGNNGDLHEKFDHKKLHDILQTKHSWIMTYNDCSYIRILYNKYKIIEVNWNYGMNKSKKSSEIIIISNSLDDLLIDKNYMDYVVQLENKLTQIIF